MTPDEFDVQLNKRIQAMPYIKRRLWHAWLKAFAANRAGRATDEQKKLLQRIEREHVRQNN